MTENLAISATPASPAAPSACAAVPVAGALPKFVELLLAYVTAPAQAEAAATEPACAGGEHESCEASAACEEEVVAAAEIPAEGGAPVLPPVAESVAAVPAARVLARESALEAPGAESLPRLERASHEREQQTGAAAERRPAPSVAPLRHREVSKDAAGPESVEDAAPASPAAEAATPADAVPRSTPVVDAARAARADEAASAGAASAAATPAGHPERAGPPLPAHAHRLLPELPASNEVEILRSAQLLHRQGGGEARIELVPPQLGELEVRLVVTAETVQLVLRADQALVADLLSRHLPELRAALEASGLALDKVEVSFQAPADEQRSANAQAQQREAEARRNDGRDAAAQEPNGQALGRRAGARLAASLGAIDAWA